MNRGKKLLRHQQLYNSVTHLVPLKLFHNSRIEFSFLFMFAQTLLMMMMAMVLFCRTRKRAFCLFCCSHFVPPTHLILKTNLLVPTCKITDDRKAYIGVMAHSVFADKHGWTLARARGSVSPFSKKHSLVFWLFGSFDIFCARPFFI